MKAGSEVYEQLNKDWKSTCRILLGEELGELSDYGDWLSEFLEKRRVEKSAISGKEVHPSLDEYCKGAKFISFDEIDFNKKFEPLDINEIKDIDSVLEAVQERAYYAGNIVLGNSKFVEGSSNITDGIYIYNSYFADQCQHAAYSGNIKSSKYSFGSYVAAFVDYSVRSLCVGPKCQRIFETYWLVESSDIYYSANLDGCSEMMFCFNLRGRRNNVGNLQLPKEKYLELKKKLLVEMAEHAKKKRTSLISMMSAFPKEKVNVELEGLERALFDIKPVQEAFEKTYKILLKKTPRNIDKYSRYFLKRRVPEILELKDTASHEVIPFGVAPGIDKMPKHRLISENEAAALSKNPLSLSEQEVESLSLDDPAVLSKIAFTIVASSHGKTMNLGKAPGNMNAADCYSGFGYVWSKYCGFCFWPRESSYAFGSAMVFDSSFCINSYYSTKLTRAFEADSCTSCSDIYFAHNCENVHNSMFCFNVKNVRNAIGNAELPQEQYAKVKDALVEQIANELEKKKDFKWDIYNIGCYKNRCK